MMDKKISKSDNIEKVELLLDRSISLGESIKIFSESIGISLMDDGSINYKTKDERCLLKSILLKDEIEMGYFDYQLNIPVKVKTAESDLNDMIALSFNFGEGLEQSFEKMEEVTKEGITNSIFINNAKVGTQMNVVANKRLHMFVIRYKKSFLRRHFAMANYFMEEILEKDGPVILYSDFNYAIIQALRSMEIHKIPKLTRIPFLIGKSLVLMSLVLEGLEERKSNKLLKINSREFNLLLKAKQFIVNDWQNPPSIQQVSEFLGMSPTKAKGLFKQLFGKPIYTYFQEQRMAEALRFINEGQMSIAEIGHELGYKNLGHFAESFKKQYGILPKKLSNSVKSKA